MSSSPVRREADCRSEARLRVLVSAYACDPDGGSEPGAGWSWARAAAEEHDVWLLTRRNNGPAIDAELERNPSLTITPVYIDLPPALRRWKRGHRGIHLYALLWQGLAYSEGRRVVRRECIDLGHHVTFATDWLPAGIAFIPGLPTIWGPVGGATRTPLRQWRWLGFRGAINDAVRLVAGAGGRITFGYATAQRARLTVAQNRDTARALRRHASRLVIEPNVGITGVERRHGASVGPGDARSLVMSGRLLPWKGLRLAIAALTHLPESWTLEVYGDGPDRERCQRAVARQGLGPRVTFHGKQPRNQVLAAVSSAAVVLHPSLHDSAPWSVGEALSIGTPVVALDIGGPSELLSEGGGVLVPPNQRLPEALAAAVVRACCMAAGSTKDWSASRLPDVIRPLYREALSHGLNTSAPRKRRLGRVRRLTAHQLRRTV
jgi:glycosyltransferase involved in cell wall biosynthesis